MALNENLKKVMIELGYEGGFCLEDLIEDVVPYFKTLWRTDAGTFGATGPGVGVGFVEGCASPEDAIATLWIRTCMAFDGKVKKKRRSSKRETKLKGEAWGQNLKQQ